MGRDDGWLVGKSLGYTVGCEVGKMKGWLVGSTDGVSEGIWLG